MYIRRLLILVSFLWIGLSFSSNSYAAPNEESDSFFKTFTINQEELKKAVEGEELGLYSISKNGTTTLQDSSADLNEYKTFTLNKGYNKLSHVTFANTKVFSGKGEVNTMVGVNVFNFNKDGECISTDSSIQTIGISGVYNSSISLKVGDNNLIIVVKQNDTLLYRLFKIVVKQEQTKGELENIQLNLMEITKPVVVETKSTQSSILKSILGSPAVDAVLK